MRGELNKETGEIRGVRVQDGGATDRSRSKTRSTRSRWRRPTNWRRAWRWAARSRIYKDTSPLGRIAAQTGQAGHLPEGARGGARHGVPGVRAPRKGSAERDGEADRGPGRDLRPGQGRGALPQARAVAAGAVQRGRARARGAAEGGPRSQGAAGDCEPGGAGAGVEPVPERGAGDLRQHGGDSRDCARGRRADQDRGA